MRPRSPRSGHSTIQGIHPRRLLYVEASARLRARLVGDVSSRGFLAETAATRREARGLLDRGAYPIVIVGDPRQGERDDGFWQALRECHTDTLVIVLSREPASLGGQQAAAHHHNLVASLGAPWEVDELIEALHRASRLHDARHTHSAPPLETGKLSRLLLVEDMDSDAFLVEVQLRDKLPECAVKRVTSLSAALAVLEDERFDMIISDLSVRDARGLDTVLRLQTAASETPLVVISGIEDEEIALRAVQAGAQDFINKEDLRGTALVRSLRYAEQRKRSEVRLVKLANFDPLTGLSNRAQFVERLGQTLVRARRRGDGFGVMYIDLDGFKAVNDTLGHDAGDEVLKEVGRRLEAVVRDSDLIARLGGDEFAAIMENLPSPMEARQTAERLLGSLSRPYGQGAAARVTASIGIAFYPDAAHTVAGLLKAADRAMYDAKRRGRNTYEVFTTASIASTHPELQLAAELKRALSRDEFCLRYQPQVDEQGALCSVEGLLRWQRGGERLLPPAEFLPLLETSSDIVEVGLWVARSACQDFARWRDAGLALSQVAVNVSARQLEDPDFVLQIEQVLSDTGVAPAHLELEITESTVMKDPERVRTVLGLLRELGVRLAMDDFGTGHSSLAHLARMPFDTVKIDRSFVRDLLHNSRGRAVTRAILTLAQELGLRTVAEGVEAEAQRRWLREEGCSVFQGYLVGLPTAANLIEHAMTVPAAGAPRTIPVAAPRTSQVVCAMPQGHPERQRIRRLG